MARYSSEQKQQTREKIVRATAKRIRKHGIDASGVATLMGDAGLTVGGFYAHFDSKDELVEEAIVLALAETPGASATPFDLGAFIETYLSKEHRNHPERGCPIAALLPELLRQPKTSRDVFLRSGHRTIEQIARHLPGRLPEAERTRRAFAVFSLMMGALQMSRFMTDKRSADEILEIGRDAARKLAHLP